MQSVSEGEGMKKIAITGSIGSGKSTVSQYLRSRGFYVADSDAIVKDLYQQDNRLKARFVEWFGESIILNGEVDKRRLKQLFLEDQHNRKKVETYVHQRVKERLFDFMDQHSESAVVFCEVPLLFEVNWQHEFDETWLVVTSRDVLIKRLQSYRGMSLEAIEHMLMWQMSVEDKIAKADVVIENQGSLERLYELVDQLVDKEGERNDCS